MNYSWDDNLAKPDIVLTVFESQSKTYDLTILSQAEPLTYENYFYIAFAATFKYFQFFSFIFFFLES